MIRELFETQFREAFSDFADNPFNTFRVYELSNHVRSRPSHIALLRIISDRPELKAMYAEKYQIDRLPNLDELMKLPETTLGGAYARFMKQQNYDPSFYEGLDSIQNLADFVEQRLRHDHDIWHVVSGFDTSYPGEMGVVSLYLTQLKLPVASAMLSACFARLIDHPDEVDGVMNCMTAAWTWGREAKSFLGLRWEESWDCDLARFRIDLGLPAMGIAPQEHSIHGRHDGCVLGGKYSQLGDRTQIELLDQ